MLDDITQLLIDIDFISSENEIIDRNIHWSHHISVYVHLQNGRKIFIKLSKNESQLKNEFIALKSIQKCLPAYITTVHDYVSRNNVCYIIYEGVEGSRLKTIDALLLYTDHWQTFFGGMQTAFMEERHQNLDAIVAQGKRNSQNFRKYYDSYLVFALRNLKPVLQHGDLAENNIILYQRHPIILDWEDFGILSIPGFDLALLIGSLLHHNAEKIIHYVKQDHPNLATITQTCELSVTQFVQLMPLYYAAFSWLKGHRNYRTSISNTANEVMDLISSYHLHNKSDGFFGNN